MRIFVAISRKFVLIDELQLVLVKVSAESSVRSEMLVTTYLFIGAARQFKLKEAKQKTMCNNGLFLSL